MRMENVNQKHTKKKSPLNGGAMGTHNLHF